MQSNSTFGIFMSLAFTVVSLSMGMETFAQEEIAHASMQNDGLILIIPKASLRQTVADTVLPTLSNSGKGLMHIESISLPEAEKEDSYNIMGGRNTKAIRDEGFTESEMINLEEQKSQMEEYYNYDWLRQLKRERIQFDLEGIIRGINTPPLF